MASFLSTQVRNFLCCTDGLTDASSLPGVAGDNSTDNTAPLQTALNDTSSNGVAITVPGTYLITKLLTSSGASPTAPNSTSNVALTIPSNKTLYLGRGVTLKLASQSNCYMLENSVPTINGATAGNSNISVIGEGTIDANGGFHLPPYVGSPGAANPTSWTEGSKTLTCTAAFTNYAWTSGDTFQPTKFGIASLSLTSAAGTTLTTASGTPFTNYSLSGTDYLNVTSAAFNASSANGTITSATVFTKTGGFTNYSFRVGDTIAITAGTGTPGTYQITRKLDNDSVTVSGYGGPTGSSNNTFKVTSAAMNGTYTISATNGSTTITVPTIPAVTFVALTCEVMQVPASNPSYTIASRTSANAIVLGTSPFTNKAWTTVYGDVRTQTSNASDVAAATRWIGHALSFKGVDNLTVGGMRIINCFKYALAISNFNNLYCPPITYYNTLSGSDGTHLMGPCNGFEITSIFGTTGDNEFACGATSGTYFSSQELAAYGSGNMSNGHVGSIVTVTGFEPVRFFGDSSTSISNIRIDSVSGSVTSGSGVNLIDDSVGGLTGCFMQGISIGTIQTTHTSFDNVLNTSPMLSISSTGCKDLSVDNLINYNADRCESVNIGSSGATAVILDRLNIKNLVHGSSTVRAYTRALRVYELAGITGLSLNLTAYTNTNTLFDLVGYIRGGTITLHEDMIGPGTTFNFATPTTAVVHNFAVTGYSRHASPQGNNTWITCNKATAVVHHNSITFDNNGIYSTQFAVINHASADLTIAGSGITYIRGASNPTNVFVIIGANGTFNCTNPDFFQVYGTPSIANGAAATAIMAITTLPGAALNIMAFVTAHRQTTAGVDSGSRIMAGPFYNNGGTLAQVGTTTFLAANKDTNIAAPTFSVATNVLSLNAVGATGFSTTWKGRIQMQSQA